VYLLLWPLGECHDCKSHFLWISSHESFDDFHRFRQQLLFQTLAVVDWTCLATIQLVQVTIDTAKELGMMTKRREEKKERREDLKQTKCVSTSS
jgi:hypothetical protein